MPKTSDDSLLSTWTNSLHNITLSNRLIISVGRQAGTSFGGGGRGWHLPTPDLEK